MKIFKYQFSKLISILIYVGIGLCIVGLGLNIYLLLTSDIASDAIIAFSIIQYSLMFIIPITLLVILISLLISSYYSIDGKTFKTSFGIIKSKYDISNIETLLLDRTTDKLSVFFKDKSFIVVVVKEEWYNEFIDAMCKANSKIEFSIKSKDSTDEDKKA